MTFTVYYVQSSGQPENGRICTDDREEAVSTWLNYTRSIYSNAGGRAVLEHEDGRQLVWLEGAEGGHATGELAEELIGDDDSCPWRDDPAEIASQAELYL
jgi:hypothetical protein